MINHVTPVQVEAFLRLTDRDFPVPLSKKTDLHELACKLVEKGTICAIAQDGEILAMAAGYTRNLLHHRAYLSVLAVHPDKRGEGLGTQVLTRFIGNCSACGADAIHLYTTMENDKAISLYTRFGFVPFADPEETRPDDVHLILYFNK